MAVHDDVRVPRARARDRGKPVPRGEDRGRARARGRRRVDAREAHVQLFRGYPRARLDLEPSRHYVEVVHQVTLCARRRRRRRRRRRADEGRSRRRVSRGDLGRRDARGGRDDGALSQSHPPDIRCSSLFPRYDAAPVVWSNPHGVRAVPLSIAANMTTSGEMERGEAKRRG